VEGSTDLPDANQRRKAPRGASAEIRRVRLVGLIDGAALCGANARRILMSAMKKQTLWIIGGVLLSLN